MPGHRLRDLLPDPYDRTRQHPVAQRLFTADVPVHRGARTAHARRDLVDVQSVQTPGRGAGCRGGIDAFDARVAAIGAYAVLQAALFISVFLLTRIPVVLRLVTPPNVRRIRVRRAAVAQFLAHGIHETEARTGVLIFAALYDHRVEVVADEGVHRKAPAEVWGNAALAITKAMQDGRPATGFEAAISLCGDVLAEHFPPSPSDVNELPDRLVVI